MTPLGLFQQRPSQGWGTREQILDPVYSINTFYDALAEVEGYESMRITEAAQAVQRSAFPEAYADHEDDARVLASALTGETTGGRFWCVTRADADDESDDLDDAGLTARAAVVREELGNVFGELSLGGFAPGGVTEGHMEGSAHYDGRAVDVFVRPVNDGEPAQGLGDRGLPRRAGRPAEAEDRHLRREDLDLRGRAPSRAGATTTRRPRAATGPSWSTATTCTSTSPTDRRATETSLARPDAVKIQARAAAYGKEFGMSSRIPGRSSYRCPTDGFQCDRGVARASGDMDHGGSHAQQLDHPHRRHGSAPRPGRSACRCTCSWAGPG